MDGNLATWVGVGVIVGVQLLTFGFLIGIMKQEIRSIRLDLDDHRNMDIQRAHPGRVERRSEGS